MEKVEVKIVSAVVIRQRMQQLRRRTRVIYRAKLTLDDGIVLTTTRLPSEVAKQLVAQGARETTK